LLLDTHRPSRCLTFEIELEDQSHGLDLDRVDDETLLHPATTLLHVRSFPTDAGVSALVPKSVELQWNVRVSNLGLMLITFWLTGREQCLPLGTGQPRYLRGCTAGWSG
jgi:hypothetical protein